MVKQIGVYSPEEIFADIISRLDSFMDDLADSILRVALNNIYSGDFSPAVGIGALDRGGLARSGRVKRELLKKTIIFDAPYAAYVEYGTRPHFPPLDPIAGWVRRNIKVSLKTDPSRKRKATMIESRAIAKRIVNHIGKYGTIPRPFLRRAIGHVTSPNMLIILTSKYFGV